MIWVVSLNEGLEGEIRMSDTLFDMKFNISIRHARGSVRIGLCGGERPDINYMSLRLNLRIKSYDWVSSPSG